MLDLGSLEESKAPVDLVGNASVKERLLNHARLGIAAIEHGNLAAKAALVHQGLDLFNQPMGLE